MCRSGRDLTALSTPTFSPRVVGISRLEQNKGTGGVPTPLSRGRLGIGRRVDCGEGDSRAVGESKGPG